MIGRKQMKIEEIRKMAIDVITNIDSFSESELAEIRYIADLMKKAAIYEEFCIEKEETDE